jgi:hypothetical protein
VKIKNIEKVFTEKETELLIECIQYRLESDKTLSTDEVLREDLEELLFKVEDFDEYL